MYILQSLNVFGFIPGYGIIILILAERTFGNMDEVLAAFEDGGDCLWKATTPAKMEGYAKQAGLKILYNIGADGISFVLADKVNAASDEAFDKWMEYIYKNCEEPSIVGYSLHGLLIGMK